MLNSSGETSAAPKSGKCMKNSDNPGSKAIIDKTADKDLQDDIDQLIAKVAGWDVTSSEALTEILLQHMASCCSISILIFMSFYSSSMHIKCVCVCVYIMYF